MNHSKLTLKESAHRNKIINRYWTAIAIVKMCSLAGEYSNEIDGVDLTHLSKALSFAFEELHEIGLELCPAYGQGSQS